MKLREAIEMYFREENCVLKALLILPMAMFLASAGEPHALSEVSFLCGEWTAANGSSSMDEVWSQPANKTIIGMYREMENHRTTFYEFLVLSQEPEGIVLRMKHFDQNLKGWEEKDQSVTFDAVTISAARVVFVSRNSERPTTLEYHQDQPHRLEGVLTRVRNGKTLRDEFHYLRRQQP